MCRLTVPRVTYRLRVLASRLHALPDFIIIGAQKGGTTSLYAYLAAHPWVMPASKKEVHFFDNHFGAGLAWYRRHFPPLLQLRARGAITGEASPYYLYHPHTPGRIANALPRVRLIVCLRNPIDRAVSHYWHQVELGREPLSMEQAFEVERERIGAEAARVADDGAHYSPVHRRYSYLDRGQYADQLERYFQSFPRRQILVVKSEDLFRDTQAAYDGVCRFLGLAPRPLLDRVPRNAGTYHRPLDPGLRRELARFFQPHNERLYGLLGERYDWA